MKNDPFDDPDMKAFLQHARTEMFPKMKASAMSITLVNNSDPDPKLCVELGAAILFDKPIIVLAPENYRVPANLKRCAATIIQGDLHDEATLARLREEMAKITKNDSRTRPGGLS